MITFNRNKTGQLKAFIGAAAISMAAAYSSMAMAAPSWVGVNLGAGEFGAGNLPGTRNTDYTYPTHAEIDYYSTKRMNVIRLPFLWERVQHQQYGNLEPTDISIIDDLVDYASARGMATVLDVHNYGRYYNQVIGAAVPKEAFADLWYKLAMRYKNKMVIFNIMNEPNNETTETWFNAAQAAVYGIRNAGARNLILVPGNGWTGAWSWDSNYYGTPNKDVMINIQDPGNYFAYDVHQYFDRNCNGANYAGNCDTYNGDSWVNLISSFTQWCKANGKHAFLGEYNFSDNSYSAARADEFLTYIDQNTDVWLGHTYWAGGPWWGDYAPRVLDPVGGAGHGPDRYQMATIMKHGR